MSSRRYIAAVDGQPDAFNEAIHRVEPIALAFARRLPPELRDKVLDDLRQEGYLAVIRCWSRFDVEHGAPFAAYAGRCIVGAMLLFMRWERKQCGMVRGDERRGGQTVRQAAIVVPIEAALEEAIDVPSPGLHGRVESDDHARWIQRQIAAVCKRNERRALLMCAVGVAEPDIAARIGLSTRRVRQLKAAGRTRLRRRLASSRRTMNRVRAA